METGEIDRQAHRSMCRRQTAKPPNRQSGKAENRKSANPYRESVEFAVLALRRRLLLAVSPSHAPTMLDSEAWALAQRYLLHAEWQNGRSDPEAIQSWRHAQGVLHAIARKRSSAASTGASALSAVAPMLAALDAASRASARIASNPNYIDLSVLPLPAGQPHSFDLVRWAALLTCLLLTCR